MSLRSTLEFHEDSTDSSGLHICDQYQRQEPDHLTDKDCQALHICEQFIRDEKKHLSSLDGQPCQLSHQFLSKDFTILRSFGISENNPNNIKLVSDVIFPHKWWPKSYIPDTCKYYNTSAQCSKNCQNLHICASFGSLGCKNKKCSFAHTLADDKEKQKLENAGFHTESMNAFDLYLKLLKRKKDPTPGYTVTPQAFIQRVDKSSAGLPKPSENYKKTIYICPNVLSKGRCSNEKKTCLDIHPSESRHLFAWQYKNEGPTSPWLFFEKHENEALEAKYTMPEIDYGILDGTQFKVIYDFNKMKAKIYHHDKTFKQAKLRRIEARNLQWNIFYRYRYDANPWRIFRNFRGSGIDSEELDKTFRSLEENDSYTVEFTIRNLNRASTVTIHMFKCFGDELIFQVKSNGDAQVNKRRPHWAKPSTEEYLRIPQNSTNQLKPLKQNQALDVDHEGNCLYHLEKPSKNQSCAMYAYADLDFLWLVQNNGSSNWLKVPSQTCQLLDRYFRNPQIDEVTISSEQLLTHSDTTTPDNSKNVTVSFHLGCFRCTYTGSSNSRDSIFLCRLNYPNSPWEWYWEDIVKIDDPRIPAAVPKLLEIHGYESRRRWVQYGKIGHKNRSAHISSKIIEHQFLKIPEGKITIPIDDKAHEIDFKTFQQRNLKSGKSRRVLRRPKVSQGFDIAQVIDDEKAMKTNLNPSMDTRNISQEETEEKFLRSYPLPLKNTKFREMHSGKEYEVLKEAFDKIEGHFRSYFKFQDDELKENYQKCRDKILETRQLKNLNETILLKEVPVLKHNESSYHEAVAECIKKGAQLTTKLVPPESSTNNSIDYNFYAIVVVLVCAGKTVKFEQSRCQKTDEIESTLIDSYVDDVDNPTLVEVTKKDQILPLYIVRLEKLD